MARPTSSTQSPGVLTMPLPALISLVVEGLALLGITEAAGVAFTTLRKVLAESAKKAMTAGLAEEAAVKKAIELHAADLAVVRKVMAGEKAQKASAAARIKDRIAGKDPTIKAPAAAAETVAPAAAVEGEVVAEGAAKTAPKTTETTEEKTTKPLGKLAKLLYGIGGVAGTGVIFDLTGRAMHPQESGLMGGGQAAGNPDEEALAQLQAMMSRGGGMGGMGGNTGFEPGGDLREMYNKSRGAVSVLNTREGTRPSPPMNSVGVGLDVLTQGYEDMLDRIAHKEPMTLTEAYARHGIVVPNQNMA